MARAIIYLFICCCGMATFFIIVTHTAEHVSTDTLFGFAYGMFFSFGTIALRDWLKRRGISFNEQGGRAPERRS